MNIAMEKIINILNQFYQQAPDQNPLNKPATKPATDKKTTALSTVKTGMQKIIKKIIPVTKKSKEQDWMDSMIAELKQLFVNISDIKDESLKNQLLARLFNAQYDDGTGIPGSGDRLLHCVAEMGEDFSTQFIELVKSDLKDNHITWAAQNSRQETPLISAVKKDNLAFINFLLQKNSTMVERVDYLNMTPIYHAVIISRPRNLEILNTLLKHGTKVNHGNHVNIATALGRTPLDILLEDKKILVADENIDACIKLLKTYNACSSEQLFPVVPSKTMLPSSGKTREGVSSQPAPIVGVSRSNKR